MLAFRPTPANPTTVPDWPRARMKMAGACAALVPAEPCGAARASRPRGNGAPHAAGSTAGPQKEKNNQRHRPSYTVSPAGQRLKRSRPAPGAAQAVGRHKKSPADEAREASLESQKEVLTDKNYKIYFKECQ